MIVSRGTLRTFLELAAAIAPQGAKHFIYRRCFGWEIHPTARFGMSLLAVDHLVAEQGVRVSHLNVFKGCELVHLGREAHIGPLNWVTATPLSSALFPASPERRTRFVLGAEAAITTRHYISCNDEVVLGPFSVLGGLHSRILTHGPDLQTATQRTSSVHIGERALVTANCTLLAGASVPARSVIASGATVVGPLAEELVLYGGVPARRLKELSADIGFFTRERGDMG